MRPNIKKVPVVDERGNELYTVPREDAVSFIAGGLAHSVNGRSIRFLDTKRPRSQPTSSALGLADVEALVKATRMSERRRERLQGWNLLPTGAIAPIA
jgi:hypothetical protein